MPSPVSSTVNSVPGPHAREMRIVLGRTIWPLVESRVVSIGKTPVRLWHKPIPISTHQLEPAVGLQVILPPAPQDRVAEEAGQPHGEAQQVLQGNQEEKARRPPVVQHVTRGSPSGGGAQQDGRGRKRPPLRLHRPQQ